MYFLTARESSMLAYKPASAKAIWADGSEMVWIWEHFMGTRTDRQPRERLKQPLVASAAFTSDKISHRKQWSESFCLPKTQL